MLAVTATLSLLFTMGVAVARVSAQPHERTVTEPDQSTKETPVLPSGVLWRAPVAVNRTRLESARAISSTGSVTVGEYRHHSAGYWNWRYRTMRHLAYIRHKRIRQLTRVLLARPSVTEAINLAATVYGNGATLWQLARCESRLDPHARNPSSSTGLFQILYPSTWRTTPFSGFDVYSAYANALAAGYMLAHGRRGEWVC